MRAKPKLWARSASRKGKAQAHLLPQPGHARLPWPLGYTRLPQPVRAHSQGGWVSKQIKVSKFSGLLDVFYIRASTKISAKMTSQNVLYECITRTTNMTLMMLQEAVVLQACNDNKSTIVRRKDATINFFTCCWLQWSRQWIRIARSDNKDCPKHWA